ncbi:MAG: HigA family addiction module antidote protein [Candidatus Lambdaproteobacteria bacterium]|nr:HigA family addiction module antidote protein [Candidatus Lambdaproteobacteria bacterium]
MQMHNPPHPGAVLRGLYMEPLGLSVSGLARTLGMSRKALSQIVNGHARITPNIAVRLSRAFDNSPEGWMNLQAQYDLWQERPRVRHLNIPVLHRGDSARRRA